jgi:glycosyltransferase involved in cell wall biosynthesis
VYTEDSKKIMIIGPSLKMGGIERASTNIANFAAKNGHQVIYIAIFRQERFLELNHNIEFIEPPVNLNVTKLNLFRSVLWLRKQIRRSNPDTVMTFNYFYAAIVRLAMVGISIPCYVSDRASPLYKWQKHVAIFNYFVYKLFPPTGVIAQTKIAAEYKLHFFGTRTKIWVIPNALREVKLFPEVKRKKQVLAVGRLNDYLKGFDRLVEAFASIENKEWQLVFAGGNEEGFEIKKQATKLGISHQIKFLGKVSDIDRVYAESSIFVIPSRSEGFPNALCEAMAAGMACIAFDFVAGPREIISDGINGIIVEDGNINALAAKIDDLIGNEVERARLGKNAAEVSEKLGLEKIGKKYLDFILQC